MKKIVFLFVLLIGTTLYCPPTRRSANQMHTATTIIKIPQTVVNSASVYTIDVGQRADCRIQASCPICRSFYLTTGLRQHVRQKHPEATELQAMLGALQAAHYMPHTTQAAGALLAHHL